MSIRYIVTEMSAFAPDYITAVTPDGKTILCFFSGFNRNEAKKDIVSGIEVKTARRLWRTLWRR